jgi:hypothetical protein
LEKSSIKEIQIDFGIVDSNCEAAWKLLIEREIKKRKLLDHEQLKNE